MIVGDLLRSAPVPPEVRAGLYRATAHIRGVRYGGEVSDPLDHLDADVLVVV